MKKYYIFTIAISGHGNNIEEAWEAATLGFSLEPGTSDDVIGYKIENEDGSIIEESGAGG
jgi:hypothetical protein